MKKFFTAVLLATVILLSTLSLSAQDAGDKYEVGTFHVIKSNILNQQRRLIIHLPASYSSSSKSYPVFYMTYADHRETYFLEVVNSLTGLSSDGYMPEMIIVGVDNLDRYGDHLPLQRGGEPGRADKFLEFFNQELFPYVEKSYRTKPFRLFFGPQAAAGFAFYASFISPKTFNACIVNNPFWVSSNRDYFLKLAEDTFQARSAEKQFLFFTYKDSFWGDPGEVEYMDKFKDLSTQFDTDPYSVHFNYLQDYHYFGDPSGLEAGLRKYFVDYKLFEQPEAKSLEEIKAHYQDLSDQYGYSVEIAELTLVFASDATQSKGFIDEAMEILLFTETIYPNSTNAMMRLGSIYRERNEYAKALSYFKRGLEQYPDNEYARNMIKELEGKLK